MKILAAFLIYKYYQPATLRSVHLLIGKIAMNLFCINDNRLRFFIPTMSD